MTSPRKLILFAALGVLLSGCGLLEPHKIDVQQGNLIDADKLAAVEIGMTRAQVRFLIGTPILSDAFQPHRWDYLYYSGKAGTPGEIRRVTLFFDGNVLVRKLGDYTGPASANES